jgi:hypothetical protein
MKAKSTVPFVQKQNQSRVVSLATRFLVIHYFLEMFLENKVPKKTNNGPEPQVSSGIRILVLFYFFSNLSSFFAVISVKNRNIIIITYI